MQQVGRTALLSILGIMALCPAGLSYDKATLQDKLGTAPLKLNLTGVTASQVLNALAQKARIPIVITAEGGALLEINYSGTPLYEVFCNVLDRAGLDCAIEGSTLKVFQKALETGAAQDLPTSEPEVAESPEVPENAELGIIPEFEQLRQAIETNRQRLTQAAEVLLERLAKDPTSKGYLVPKNEFESDFDYIKRLSRDHEAVNKARREALALIQEKVREQQGKWIEFSQLDLSLDEYDANEESYKVTATSRVYSKEEYEVDLNLKPRIAKALREQWDNLSKTGYLESGPGGLPYWVRLKIEAPKISTEKASPFVTELFDMNWQAPGTPLGFHPDGDSLYYSDSQQLIRLIPRSDKRIEAYFIAGEPNDYGEYEPRDVQGLYFDSESKRLGVILKSRYNDILLFKAFDAESGAEQASFEVSGDCFALSPDGRYLASDADGVSIYSVDSGKAFFQANLEGTVKSLAFSPNGRTLAVGLEQNWNSERASNLVMVDLTTKQSKPLGGLQQSVEWLAFGPDGNVVATQEFSDKKMLGVITPLNGRVVRATYFEGTMSSLQFLQDKKTLVYGTKDDESSLLHYLDYPKFSVILESTWGKTDNLLLSPDGKYLTHEKDLMRSEFLRPK